MSRIHHPSFRCFDRSSSIAWLRRRSFPWPSTFSGGHLLNLEVNPRHAEVARANLIRAGLSSTVEVRIGPATESLTRLMQAGERTFDFVFLDADKPSCPDYLEASVRLSSPGALIVVDNVVRDGKVAGPGLYDANGTGVRVMNEFLSRTPGLSATTIHTVGRKGYDGFTLIFVEKV